MTSTHKVLAAIAVIVGIVVPANLLTAAGRSGQRPAGEVDGARYRLTAAEAKRDGARLLTRQMIEGTFTFASGTDPAARQAILAAVASARPEARRLIDLVDGLVTIHVGDTGRTGAAGVTMLSDDPGYSMTLDLQTVFEHLGQRGIDRLVLHELGHVVDHAIVPAALDRRLAAGIPVGYGCEQGVSGACATRDERFAESFAKWAMNDIGVDLDIGYKVMPPEPTLDAWGTPLARLS
ncbi:MAG: hypothetical protein ACXVFL_14015 [Solirubrobacteraceae bacterium]